MRDFFIQMKIALIISTILLAHLVNYAQESNSAKSIRYADEIVSLDLNGKLDEAVSLSGEALKFEQKIGSNSSVNLANAYLNVAILRKKRTKQDRILLASKSLGQKEENDVFDRMRQDLDVSENAFRKALKIFEKNVKADSLSLATAKFELAEVLTLKMSGFGFLFFEATDKIIFKYLDEIGELYQESFDIRENILGVEDETTLSSLFVLAVHELNQANFEKALPLFEKFLAGAKSSNSDQKKVILPVLRKMAEILIAIEDETKGKQILGEISAITNLPEEFPKPDRILNDRLLKPDPRSPYMTRTVRIARNDAPRSINAVSVPVFVRIGENGEVLEAVSQIADKDLGKIAEDDVKRWKFRPFELDGIKRKLKGVALYKRMVYNN